MNKPFVSICIPTYNGERYLHECIKSCLAQQYDNFEIVICDDGSSDKTREIIESYKVKDGRIRFSVNEKNLGLVGNWNKCIELAKGEWIKFVFQDDYIRPDCLTVFANAIDPHIVLMVSERHFILDEKATEGQRKYYSRGVRTLANTGPKQKNNFYSPERISALAVKNIGMNFIGEPSLSFFRKGIAEKAGMFNSLLQQICDLEFFLRIGSQWGLRYVPEKLCAFRIHQHSTTSTNITGQYFQLHYMEPLLLSWLLLYSDSFKPFRKKLSLLRKMKLRTWFSLKCYQAAKANEKGKHRHPVFESTSPVFLQIRKRKNGGILARLIDILRG